MTFVCPRVIRGNRGDLLSRQGILQALQDRGLNDIVVACHQAGQIAPLGLSTAPYGRLYNLIPGWKGFRALWRARTVLWTGGLDLQDDSSLAKLVHTLAVFTSYRLLRLRTVALMQGAGPLTTRTGRWLARRILNRVDTFVARDPKTLELLDSLNSRCRLVLAWDGIFAGDPLREPLSSSEQTLVDDLVGERGRRSIIGFNLRLWFHFASGILPYQFVKRRYQARARVRMAALLQSAAQVLRELRVRYDARILLLSMYEPDTEPWEDDLPHLERLGTLVGDDEIRVVREPLSLRGFCELIRRLDLVIGMRLHSTLTALRLGVPAIHLAYTLKGHDIFAALGLADLVRDVDEFIDAPEKLTETIARVLADEGITERVQAASEQAVSRNHAVLEQLFSNLTTERW